MRVEHFDKFISGLSKIQTKAGENLGDFFLAQNIDPMDPASMRKFIDYSYGVSTKYGEATAELACEFYDAMGMESGLFLEPAIPAPTATYGDVSKAVQGTLKTSQNTEELIGSVTRLVKMAGQDTLLKNAYRDHAQAAWIPSGDTCAFCIMLASRGWEYVSKSAARGHAEHLHSNCDCSYCVRFNGDTEVKGYDPEKYYRMYSDADGGTTEDKLNSMRRRFYKDNKDAINAQKRSAYAKRMELNSSEAEETNVTTD